MSDNDKVCPVCKRCGRKLRTDDSKARGMGKVCWEKSQHTNQLRLFTEVKHELSKDN